MSTAINPLSAHPLPGGRRHDLDWLRIIAFAILIFYHIGMFFVTWGWHVKSPSANAGPELVMALTSPWRLALLFFISGVALRFLSDKLGAGAFARERVVRLIPVILFGVFVVVPPQTFFELRQDGAIGPDPLAFYAQYAVPSVMHGVITPTWNHLWYVVYLLVYSLILAPFIPALRRFADGPAGAAVGRLWTGSAGALALLLLVPLPFIAYGVLLDPVFPTTHALVDDWANHAHRFTILMVGYFAAKSAAFWTGVRRAWPLAAAYAGGFVLLSAALAGLGWPDFGPAASAIYDLLTVIYAWSVILALLGLAQRFLNRDGPARRYLTEAIFPFYILHQTITVAAGYYIAQAGWDVWSEFAALTAITIAGCFLGFEIIRRVAVLRPLFGLKAAGTASRPRRLADARGLGS